MLSRIALVLSLVCAIGLSSSAQGLLTDQKGTAKISGQVTRSDNGKPITNAIAQLLPVGISAVGKRVKVDALGRFELTELAAGSYVLNVSAAGFVNIDATVTRPTGAGKNITLKDGEVFAKADVVMAPTSVIDGRLFDEFGDPAPGVTVQTAQLTLAVGRTRLMPMSTSMSGVTDDRGQFHIAGLPPGDYYLLAMSGPFGLPPGTSALPADDRAGFALTYFPGTPTVSEAKPVHLEVGKDAPNITFALTPGKLASISGSVVDMSGRPVGAASVLMLQTQGGDVRAMVPAAAQVGANGSFHYRNVPTGTYVLQGMTRTAFGSLLVTVDGTAQSDVTLVVRPPTTAHGQILFDGEGSQPLKDQINVTMRPTDFVSGPAVGRGMPRSHVNDDWSFDLPGLQSVGVLMAMASPPWRLKSAMLEGKDIADVPADFSRTDVSGIDVVLTSRVGALTGRVTDGDAQAARCSVIVFPDDKAKWVYPARLVTTSQSSPTGDINVRGLLPGRYLAVAVPLLLVQEISPADLESLLAAATAVTIDEGKASAVSLALIKR